MNLFELTESIQALRQRDDLDDKVFWDTLASLQDAWDVKVDNLASWFDDNCAKSELLTKRIHELQDEKRRIARQNEWIQNWLTNAIDQSGQKEVTTARHMLKTRKMPPRVEVDETKLAKQWMKVTTTEKPDKALIKQALKAGEAVDGARLVTSRKTIIK